MGLALGLAALLVVWASTPTAWAQTATVQLDRDTVTAGQKITYQASFTPTSTPVDIYMGCLLPDGFTFVSFIGSFQTGTIVNFALGPSVTPSFGNATLPGPGVFVAPFSYTFTDSEPVGTYFCYAGLVFAGTNPFVPSNRLSLDVKAFQFTTIQVPKFNLSGDQEKLIADNGKPQYLTILFNSDPQRREETWTYSQIGKRYSFWDGVRVKEESISSNSGLFSNPPSIDPTLFTKDTRLSHIVQLFGDNFTSDDQSSGSFLFKTLYYRNQGLAVSLSGNNVVVVQTLDKP